MTNKTAYIYTRISSAKQVGNQSIETQIEICKRYAERYDIEILAEFSEQRSAKDFERVEWKKLESAVKKKSVNYIIVAKYDRFSRNAGEALQFLETFEKKYNIVVLSVNECYFIDPTDAMFFKLRADALVNADFERRVIAGRVLQTNWFIGSQGGYANNAPFGYENAKGLNNKPSLEIVEKNAILVKKIYELFLGGSTIGEISKTVRRIGFPLSGHSAIQRILQNPVYCGKINVLAYKNEKAQVVKGLHEAIISESDFGKVQELIGGKSSKVCTIIDSEYLPLRGFVSCNCGETMTGAPSKGKSGKLFYYYRCKKCKKVNINAWNAHDLLCNILRQLSFSKQFAKKVIIETEIAYEKLVKNLLIELKKLEKETNEAQRQSDVLLEKFLQGSVNEMRYKKFDENLQRKIQYNSLQINELREKLNFDIKFFKQNIDILTDLEGLFLGGSANSKRHLLRLIFPQGLTLTKEGYRTPFLLPFLNPNQLKIKELDIIKSGKNGNDSLEIYKVARTGVETNTLFDFLKSFSKKVA
jgi:site-specific DNA recombinase